MHCTSVPFPYKGMGRWVGGCIGQAASRWARKRWLPAGGQWGACPSRAQGGGLQRVSKQGAQGRSGIGKRSGQRSPRLDDDDDNGARYELHMPCRAVHAPRMRPRFRSMKKSASPHYHAGKSGHGDGTC